jgi:hypothetical protein
MGLELLTADLGSTPVPGSKVPQSSAAAKEIGVVADNGREVLCP